VRLKILGILASAGLAAGYGAQRWLAGAHGEKDAAARGRHATTPLAMTWLGWKDVLLRTWTEANDDRLLSVAAACAFYTVLAVAPAVSVLVSLYGLIVEPAEIFRQVRVISAFLPDVARPIIEDQAQRLTSQPAAALSWTLAISLGVAAWSANAAIKGIFDGLNVIYGETEKRSFLAFNALSLMVTLGAIVLVISALVLIAVLPQFVERGPFAETIDLLVVWLRWPLFFIAATIAISILYWIGPSRRRARWEWVIPGAAAAAFLWMTASAGFSWYVSTLGNYSSAYGSLATVIVFMTWLWLSAVVILLGAELNAELEHQTAQDTTVGGQKPIGLRGAVVADNIGPARASS
jgi:membrane protein